MGMTLDEAILHAEEVADGHDRIKQIKAVTVEECKCAEEHRQLAEWLKDYKRLKEQEPCDDAISRVSAINAVSKALKRTFVEYEEVAKGIINKLPSVNPQPKTGHWIAVENEEMETVGYYCSECDLPMETEKRTDYCPNCGVRMSEEG